MANAVDHRAPAAPQPAVEVIFGDLAIAIKGRTLRGNSPRGTGTSGGRDLKSNKYPTRPPVRLSTIYRQSSRL
jgi:hypothetical protein